MTLAVPYLRTSTDDKGQDPLRQLTVIRPWAERENVALLLDATVIDEGSSASKTNPFERKKFVLACERAKAAGADGLVVEVADRFTRRGSKEDGWAEIELGKRYGLKLFRADKSLADHGTLTGDTMDALKAEVAREWAREHAKKTKTGMANKKAEGAAFGRPKKPLTDAEIARAQELRAQGLGWRKVALELSAARGAFRIADPKKRKKATLSYSSVRRALGAE